MKRFKILSVLLALLVMGCGKDSGCPLRTNTTIHFTLSDKANNEVFSNVVNHVELFIYDYTGLLVGRSTIPEGELNTFAGKRLWLDVGVYTMVAWANITDSRSQIVENESRHYLDRTNNYIINAITSGGVAENGDALYYAPKTKSTPLTVVVPEQGKVEVTAEFRHAHVRLDIRIEGYSHPSGSATDPLKIELTHITSRYSFGMEAHGEKVSYVQYAPNIDAINKVFSTSFNVPVFDKNTTTHICITNKAGQLIIAPVSLMEILGDKIAIDELVHLPIRIVFTEKNGQIVANITVDLPQWDEDIVKPNI
ncbi:MAG: FimB/Mfa2 family fimbrial subunit [Bacteroidales bacterium]|nr:FimB/Mfa2 family fimbrial subunit [Bacteroidales bacterium]MCL2738713.1 FimB/Mfa2 family fimbrial subunit [Bacteroidales bacterium]